MNDKIEEKIEIALELQIGSVEVEVRETSQKSEILTTKK